MKGEDHNGPGLQDLEVFWNGLRYRPRSFCIRSGGPQGQFWGKKFPSKSKKLLRLLNKVNFFWENSKFLTNKSCSQGAICIIRFFFQVQTRKFLLNKFFVKKFYVVKIFEFWFEKKSHISNGPLATFFVKKGFLIYFTNFWLYLVTKTVLKKFI